MKKPKGKNLISIAPLKEGTQKKYLNRDIAIMDAWRTDNGTLATVFLSLRFLQETFQCFSSWSKQEMDVFWSFNKKIHEITWKDLLAQGGKTNKTGFAPTIIPSSKYPNQTFKDTLDPNTEFIELRANSKIRIHGFRDKSIFYICWLDKNHEICA